MLTVYQQCKGVEFTIHDVQANARDNITGVREVEKRVSAVLTHDWGVCIQFAWYVSTRPLLHPNKEDGTDIQGRSGRPVKSSIPTG